MGRWLVAFACVVLSAPAAAQDDVDADRERRARVHYESATAHFDTGDYESALREFRAAHAESPHPELLYNVFLCEERLGNLPAAIEALEAFLATPEVPRRAILERRLAHLRERASRGETRIEASEVERARPMEVEQRVEGPAPAPSDPPPSDPPPREPAPASQPPVLAIVGFTLASAGVVTFAVAGGVTLAEDASLSACRPDCAPESVEVIAASAIATDVGLGFALAGALLGVIGLVVDGGAPADRTALRWRGLALEGSF